MKSFNVSFESDDHASEFLEWMKELKGGAVTVATWARITESREVDLMAAHDPETLEAIAVELTEFHHSARADSLRVLAKKAREAMSCICNTATTLELTQPKIINLYAHSEGDSSVGVPGFHERISLELPGALFQDLDDEESELLAQEMKVVLAGWIDGATLWTKAEQIEADRQEAAEEKELSERPGDL